MIVISLVLVDLMRELGVVVWIMVVGGEWEWELGLEFGEGVLFWMGMWYDFWVVFFVIILVMYVLFFDLRW